MLELDLFSRRNFAVGNAETLAMYGGLGILFFFLTIFLQEVAGYTALESGLTVVPVTLVVFALSRRFGATGRPFRPEGLHGRRAARRVRRHPAAASHRDRHGLRHRPLARAARLRSRALAHGRAARRHRARRCGRERRRHRLCDQQRRRPCRRPCRRVGRGRRRRAVARRRHVRGQQRVGARVSRGCRHLRRAGCGGRRPRSARDLESGLAPRPSDVLAASSSEYPSPQFTRVRDLVVEPLPQEA